MRTYVAGKSKPDYRTQRIQQQDKLESDRSPTVHQGSVYHIKLVFSGRSTLNDLEGGLVSGVDLLGRFNLCVESLTDALRNGRAIDLCSYHCRWSARECSIWGSIER